MRLGARWRTRDQDPQDRFAARRLHALPRLRVFAPLPRRGEIEVTDEFCDEHDLPELVVHSGDEPWELGCPICNYHEYQARQSVGDLVDLDGVGEKTVEKLAAVGVESLDDLRESEADSIAESVQGVSAENVRSWQAKAD